MSDELEIKLLTLAMIFSPLMALSMFAACVKVLERVVEVKLDWKHDHPRPAMRVHHRH